MCLRAVGQQAGQAGQFAGGDRDGGCPFRQDGPDVWRRSRSGSFVPTWLPCAAPAGLTACVPGKGLPPLILVPGATPSQEQKAQCGPTVVVQCDHGERKWRLLASQALVGRQQYREPAAARPNQQFSGGEGAPVGETGRSRQGYRRARLAGAVSGGGTLHDRGAPSCAFRRSAVESRAIALLAHRE